MNENNNFNSGNIRPYKASGNLNTVIGNPSVNINDTMNVNIQSMTTNDVTVNNNNNINASMVQNTQNNINNNQNIGTNVPIDNSNTNININTVSSSNMQTNNQTSGYVNKTYVSVNNKAKKKNIQLKLGSEFKIALLIVVILLIFILLLPKINELFRGY